MAAIGVALFIGIAGFRLGRQTIDALVDAAPKGLADRLARTIEAVPGVAAIDSIRLRPSGAQIIGDVGIFVSRTLPLESVAAIKENVAQRIRAEWPETAVTLTANPLALDDESLLESVQLIATRLRLAVHHITIQAVEGRKCVSLDMEVDGRMALGEAHELATRLEDAIAAEVGPDIEVETHIEPMETREIHGREADPAFVEKIAAALVESAASRGALHHIHDVRVRQARRAAISSTFTARSIRRPPSIRPMRRSMRWSGRSAGNFPMSSGRSAMPSRRAATDGDFTLKRKMGDCARRATGRGRGK